MDNHYNFGIITDNNIILFNNSMHNFQCSNSDMIKEDIEFLKINGSIHHIKAKFMKAKNFLGQRKKDLYMLVM